MAIEDEKAAQKTQSTLEHIMAIIQVQVLSFHRKTVIPCMESGKRFAERHPVISLFISVFSILSFIPVATFIGFSLLVTLSFILIGVACALIASSALISGAAALLFISLGIIFLTAIFLSTAILMFLALIKVSRQITGGRAILSQDTKIPQSREETTVSSGYMNIEDLPIDS